MRRAGVLLLLAAIAAGAAPAAGQSVPPPTPVPPAGSPSPYPTALDTPEPNPDRPPKLDAAAAALVDLGSGRLLWGRREERRRPIASTTKIMTALLVLEATDPGETIETSAAAASVEGAELGLEPGEVRPVDDLLSALMLQSSNDAAVALAEHVAGTVQRFVRRMNRRAKELGLEDTRFRSPNGLDDDGYSSAADLAAITVEAYAHPAFGRIVATQHDRIEAPDGPDRRIQNRNALLWLYPDSIGVKTGFTSAAGFCLVAAAERDDLRLVAVVLGSPDEAFSDAAAVLDHGFAAYERRVAVEEGAPLDPIHVGGREVPVAAAEEIAAVVGIRDPDPIVTVEPSRLLRLPIEAGAEVGEVVVRFGDPGQADGTSTTQLHEVRAPVVAVRDVARPPPPREVPWWERIAEAVGRFVASLLGDPAV